MKPISGCLAWQNSSCWQEQLSLQLSCIACSDNAPTIICLGRCTIPCLLYTSGRWTKFENGLTTSSRQKTNRSTLVESVNCSPDGGRCDILIEYILMNECIILSSQLYIHFSETRFKTMMCNNILTRFVIIYTVKTFYYHFPNWHFQFISFY